MSVVVQTQSADTAAATDDPLLSYTVTTTPSPLKASPENPEAPEEDGEVLFSVARQSGTPADVESIKVKVPAGTMSPDLATDLAKVSPRISLDGWTARLDTATKEFVFEPAAGHTPIGPDTGFTIQLSDIPISREIGTAPVTITERSRTGESAFQNRTTIFNLGKFPADFYLRNFLCEPSIIPNGGDVRLTWERSANATYELLYGDVNRDVTDRTSLDLEGIKSDTTFYLRATTGDPTNPVVRILSAQVSVLKPDLEVGNLIVNGSVTGAAGQPLQIASHMNLTHGLTSKGSVTVDPGDDGYLWLATGRLDAKAGTDVNVYGTLAATTIKSTANRGIVFENSINQTSGDIVTSGNITAVGPETRVRIANLYGPEGLPLEIVSRVDLSNGLTCDNATVSAKTISVGSGGIVATDGLSLFRGRYNFSWNKGHTPIYSPFKATAPTDGVLYCQIDMFDSTSNNDAVGKKAGWEVTVGSQTYRCQEAIMRATGTEGRRNSLSMAVRKGEGISAMVVLDSNVFHSRVGAYLIWYPMGVNKTLTVTSRGSAQAETDDHADSQPLSPEA
ncbi:hypothetical protein [Streptomyces sp. NPDC012756]|uniref:hypothetical protein n=1 Tax=Streptomyces sp. NPDC012756 TaxID=3364847 RepID=UPI0036A245A7